MPVERLRAGLVPGTITCLNAYWDYARTAGIFDLPNWDTRSLNALLNTGSTCWNYYRGSDGRIDGVCIYKIKPMQPPAAPAPMSFLNVEILAVRADLLPTTNERLRASFNAANGVVTEGLRSNPGVVGVTCEFETTNADLRTLTDSFPNVVYENTRQTTRAWFRRQDFLPRFDQWVTDSGANEPIIP